MKRPRGNPDFGTKYKFNFGREKPLTDQVKAAIYPETKEQLKKLADDLDCSVPDLVRDAISQYLNSFKKIDN